MAEEAEPRGDQERGYEPSTVSSSASSKPFKVFVTNEAWEKRLRDSKIRKEDMNKLVISYLAYVGYVEAAKMLEIESSTQPDGDFETVIERLAVLKEVEHGNMEETVQKINVLDPEILRTNPHLLFCLQQQNLIELIRSGDVEETLMVKFAQEELGPLVEENPGLQEDLEQTMALLIFKDSSSCLVGKLLDVSRRQTTAWKLKEAIQEPPKLIRLLTMLRGVQIQLSDIASFPRLDPLGEPLV